MNNLEIGDMLVFEDEDGNIYQDCVLDIRKQIDISGYLISLNGCCLGTDLNYNINYIYYPRGTAIIKEFQLKEIWHKTDEDTYKKVWSK